MIVELIGQRLNVFKRLARLLTLHQKNLEALGLPTEATRKEGKGPAQARPSALPSHL